MAEKRNIYILPIPFRFDMGYTQIGMNMDDEDIRELKSQGINRTKFMKQAIQAHRDGLWKYKYLDE